MTLLFQKIIVFLLIPVLTMMVGGFTAVFRQPNGLVLHFAAGVVFSVVAVEILPDVVKGHNSTLAIIGFTLGFLLMTGIRHFLEVDEERINSLSKKITNLLTVGYWRRYCD